MVKHYCALVAFLLTAGGSMGVRLNAPKSNKRQGRFILVSGSEGSGTTMIAKVLSEDRTSMGIPTNWKLDDLSESTHEKYRNFNVSKASHFNKLVKNLWEEPIKTHIVNGIEIPQLGAKHNQYSWSGIDSREAAWRDDHLRQIGDAARSLMRAQENAVENLVYHRSMPFGGRHTPYLEDLSMLCEESGFESAHVVLVMRHLPATWLSHSNPTKYRPFLKRIERILAGELEYPNTRFTFVSYEKLLCNPEETLKELCDEVGLQVSDVLASPQIAAIGSHKHEHDKSVEYQQKLAEYEEIWNAEKHDYPLVDKFVRDGMASAEHGCTRSF